MKKVIKSIIIISMVALQSCVTTYYTRTEFNSDLSGKRTIYSPNKKFYFDVDNSWTKIEDTTGFTFEALEDTMYCAIYKNFSSISDINENGPAVLRPEESFKKTFMWLVTRYQYKVHYAQYTDCPFPIDKYFSKEEQQYYLDRKYNNIEGDEEMSENLLNHFSLWMHDNQFEIIHNAFCTFANEDQLAQLKANRDSLSANCADVEGMIYDYLAESKKFGLDFCQDILDVHPEIMDIDLDFAGWLDTRFVCQVNLLGNEKEAFEVNTDEMLGRDIDASFSTYQHNIWAYIVTILVIAGIVVIARRKK